MDIEWDWKLDSLSMRVAAIYLREYMNIMQWYVTRLTRVYLLKFRNGMDYRYVQYSALTGKFAKRFVETPSLRNVTPNATCHHNRGTCESTHTIYIIFHKIWPSAHGHLLEFPQTLVIGCNHILISSLLQKIYFNQISIHFDMKGNEIANDLSKEPANNLDHETEF